MPVGAPEALFRGLLPPPHFPTKDCDHTELALYSLANASGTFVEAPASAASEDELVMSKLTPASHFLPFSIG
eukprot:14844928-Alexandrium_andersonii.AAC.1